MELLIDEQKLHALGVRLNVTAPQPNLESSGSLSFSGRDENVARVVFAITRLGGIKSTLAVRSLENEIKKKVERRDGEVNIDVVMEDDRTVMPRIFFEAHEQGVLAIIATGGDERSISYRDKCEIARRAVEKALEIKAQ